MAFSDKTLTCKECGAEFVFTAGEQEFFAEKGFQNDPSRCPACRAARRRERDRINGGRRPREMYRVICSECGAETEVPFKPSSDRPVYCRECYEAHRARV